MEPPSGTSRIGLSVQEASRILGVSRNTVRRWCASGRLRSDRVGRPQGDSIRVFLDATPTDNAMGGDVPDDVPGDVLREVPTIPRQDVPDAPGRAQAMATYNRELIEPLVAALERSTARVAELERENGRLEAENRALLARTAPESVETAP